MQKSMSLKYEPSSEPLHFSGRGTWPENIWNLNGRPDGFLVLASFGPASVWGLGFRIWGLKFEVWGLGFGLWVLGLGMWGLGSDVWGLGFGFRRCQSLKGFLVLGSTSIY